MTSSLRTSHAALPAARNRVRPQTGFTLIETMFAMVIFALGVMSLMACVPMASKRIMKSGAQTRAASIASAKTWNERTRVAFSRTTSSRSSSPPLKD